MTAALKVTQGALDVPFFYERRPQRQEAPARRERPWYSRLWDWVVSRVL
jgi:hypothetical protein